MHFNSWIHQIGRVPWFNPQFRGNLHEIWCIHTQSLKHQIVKLANSTHHFLSVTQVAKHPFEGYYYMESKLNTETKHLKPLN